MSDPELQPTSPPSRTIRWLPLAIIGAVGLLACGAYLAVVFMSDHAELAILLALFVLVCSISVMIAKLFADQIVAAVNSANDRCFGMVRAHIDAVVKTSAARQDQRMDALIAGVGEQSGALAEIAQNTGEIPKIRSMSAPQLGGYEEGYADGLARRPARRVAVRRLGQ